MAVPVCIPSATLFSLLLSCFLSLLQPHSLASALVYPRLRVHQAVIPMCKMKLRKQKGGGDCLVHIFQLCLLNLVYLILPDFFQTPLISLWDEDFLSGLIWLICGLWNLSSVGNVKGFLLGLLEEDPESCCSWWSCGSTSSSPGPTIDQLS